MSKSEDSKKTALKVLDVLEAISGHVVDGISNGALAQQLGFTPANITNYTQTLIEKGWVRKDDSTGRFYPTANMAQVFGRVTQAISQAQQRLNDIQLKFNCN